MTDIIQWVSTKRIIQDAGDREIVLCLTTTTKISGSQVPERNRHTASNCDPYCKHFALAFSLIKLTADIFNPYLLKMSKQTKSKTREKTFSCLTF